MQIVTYCKAPIARLLSSSSGASKEDNDEKRENSEVKPLFRQAESRTDGQTDVEFEIVLDAI